MNTTALIALIIVCGVAIGAVAIYIVSTSIRGQEWLCGHKDNVFIVVYKDIEPYEEAFKGLQSFITYIIQSNASETFKIDLSLCFIDVRLTPNNLRKHLDNYTLYPIFMVYSSSLDPQKIRVLDLIFDRYGHIYLPKQDALMYIYLYFSSNYGYTYLDAEDLYPNVITVKRPPVNPNETPVIGSLDAKYYLFIYEDVHCGYCAKLYQETLPELWDFVENNTIAIVLKNMIVHEETLEIHMNIVSLYLENRDSLQVYEIINETYHMLLQGSIPSVDDIKNLIVKKVGRLPDTDRYSEDAREIIDSETVEAYRFIISGTPGLVLWNNEKEIGIVMVGFRSYETILRSFKLIS